LVFANGAKTFITGYTNTTTLTAATSQTVGSIGTPSTFVLYYGGSQLDSTGNTGVTSIYFNNGSFPTLVQSSATAARTITIPDITDTLVGLAATQTLTNKTMTGTNNVLTASLLKSATTEVSVSAATAPTTGQVLTATSGTTATWQTPVSNPGGSTTQVQY